jgi:hypothetical protein
MDQGRIVDAQLTGVVVEFVVSGSKGAAGHGSFVVKTDGPKEKK